MIKNFAIPKLLYFYLLVLIPLKDFTRTVNSLLYNFFVEWKKRRQTRKFISDVEDMEDGSLKMPDTASLKTHQQLLASSFSSNLVFPPCGRILSHLLRAVGDRFIFRLVPGGTSRKFGCGCGVCFLKQLPYFRPK